MTVIPFVKMQGNGNDFIVLDNRDGVFSSRALSEAATRFCRRRKSLGADGILVVEKSVQADFTMRLFNADGSEGEMCGNGARCISRYAFEKGIAGREQSFSTLAGIMRAVVDPPFVDLSMGISSLFEGWYNRSVEAGDRIFQCSFLWVGVPHAVLFPEEQLSGEEMVNIGRALRNNTELFPDGANVNFVTPKDEGSIYSVTYERGVEDLTESCGTGSAASAVCWILRGGPVRKMAVVDVFNPGGINTVTLSFSENGRDVSASLKGRAVMVAEGFLLEENNKEML